MIKCELKHLDLIAPYKSMNDVFLFSFLKMKMFNI